MGFFGAAARWGKMERRFGGGSVYTDAGFLVEEVVDDVEQVDGVELLGVQSRAKRSTAARSSEKGEMTASVVQQPLCRCWPRRP